MSALSPDHLPTVRKAVAEVLREDEHYSFAEKAERGQRDECIAMRCAVRAVERVLDEMFK